MGLNVRYLLPAEAAQRLKVSKSSIILWANLGRLRVTRTASGVRLIDPRDVARLQRQRERQKTISK